MGYKHVGHYPGGIEEWVESGESVESGPATDAAPTAASRSAPIAAPVATPRVTAAAARTGSSRTGRAVRALRAQPVAWIERLAALSYNRLIGLWFAMVLGLGVLYWLLALLGVDGLREAGAPLVPDLHGFLTALYFSFVTATSVGFGDVVPVGPLRALAVLEGAAGLLVFGCIVSKLVSQRQEILVEETHRIAFEDRLDRVRTNLHLVLSELQALGEAGEGAAGDRTFVRLESTTLVFSGELRTIHDLLYRPQQVPEESVLASLLVGLTANLEELAALVGRWPDARERLRPALQTIRLQASEICGQCVPRQYAPDLERWMNRIQSLAGQLEA